MKIFYAVQATGNGHIARALEIVPYLQQYGEVSIFLSGSNSNLAFDLPVRYRSRGLSLFYGNKGGLDYKKIWSELDVYRIWKEAKDLPVEKYDMVINDFESITSLACRIKKIPCVNFGHQASFQSPYTPRPDKKEVIGEMILKKYATATSYIGLHFQAYDDFIFNPIIKEAILNADPADKEYITVYLPHYADEVVAGYLEKMKDIRFEVFSKKVKQKTPTGNITFVPVSNIVFNESLINCTGIITGAGFETPAEALYLGKKLLCMPIKGQYEQLCNAAALEKFNVPVVSSMETKFNVQVKNWLLMSSPKKLTLTHNAEDIVQCVINTVERNSYSIAGEKSLTDKIFFEQLSHG